MDASSIDSAVRAGEWPSVGQPCDICAMAEQSEQPVRGSAARPPVASLAEPSAATAPVTRQPGELPATVQGENRELAELVAAGQLRRALTLLMERYGDAVYSCALRVLREEEAARDVLQQTFLAAYRDLPDFGGRSSIKTWLLTIANHRALDWVRARRRSERRLVDDEVLEERGDEQAPSVQALLDGPREARALEECLAQLTPEVRAALLMRFQQGLRYDEMARGTGERIGTLHMRVTRALPVLRRCLESKGIEP